MSLGAELDVLAQIIAERSGDDPSKSYTAKLLAGGPLRCAKKFGEEGVEFALAVAAQDDDAVAAEAADALYHLLVALASRGVSLDAVAEALARRRGVSGLAEKAARQD
jgi:phosphoribosyl-ATP pyrophosphohydrolase